MGGAKVKIIYHLKTVTAIGLKLFLNLQINELMKLKAYQLSGSLFALGQRSLRFKKLKLVSLGNY